LKEQLLKERSQLSDGISSALSKNPFDAGASDNYSLDFRIKERLDKDE